MSTARFDSPKGRLQPLLEMDLIAQVAGPAYVDRKVQKKEYWYAIEAWDASGNRSPRTNRVYATSAVDLVTPVAVAGPDRDARPGETLEFDGSASYDPDSPTPFLTWDFGDGSPVVWGARVARAFAAAGSYTVVLTGRDGEGYFGQDTLVVTVKDSLPPVAIAGSNRSAKTGEAISFDASASYDPDGSALSYSWDFGDGSAPAIGPTPTHAYSSPGAYVVRLQVTDAEGATGEDSLAVSVRRPRMFVDQIAMGSVWSGGGFISATATIKIVGEDGLPVSGVSVAGTWSGPISQSQTAITDSTGRATFRSGAVKGGGTFVFTVTGAVKSGFDYDSSANVETSDSVTRTRK